MRFKYSWKRYKWRMILKIERYKFHFFSRGAILILTASGLRYILRQSRKKGSRCLAYLKNYNFAKQVGGASWRDITNSSSAALSNSVEVPGAICDLPFASNSRTSRELLKNSQAVQRKMNFTLYHALDRAGETF